MLGFYNIHLDRLQKVEIVDKRAILFLVQSYFQIEKIPQSIVSSIEEGKGLDIIINLREGSFASYGGALRTALEKVDPRCQSFSLPGDKIHMWHPFLPNMKKIVDTSMPKPAHRTRPRSKTI